MFFHPRIKAGLVLVGCLLLPHTPPALAAEPHGFVPPTDSGVSNVRDFGARGDGRTDDTAASQKAIAKTGGHKLLYIPDGTYLISDTLLTSRGPKHKDWIAVLSIQGQSRDKTILRLKDHAPGFDDPRQNRAHAAHQGGQHGLRLPIHLVAGEWVPTHVFHLEEDGSAKASLWWETPDGRHSTISTKNLQN